MNNNFTQKAKNILAAALITAIMPCCICGCSEETESYAVPTAETSFSDTERSEVSVQENSEASSETSSCTSSSDEKAARIGKTINGLIKGIVGAFDDPDRDSDGDKLTDSDEEVLGLDPKNPQTFGVPDAEYKVKQTVFADSDALKQVNTKDSPYTLSLEITAAGNVNKTLTAGKSGYSHVVENNTQLGRTIDLKYTGGDIGEVILHFKIGDEYIENELNLYPDEKELQGVRRFNVFKYFEDINMLLPIETTIDEETNTVSATVDELGTYCVVDMEKWLHNLSEFAEGTSSEVSGTDSKDTR